MWNESARISTLGTPIQCFCQLESDDASIVLENVLAEITQSKNIVATAIAGRNGTIKEYFGSDDYKIKLTGALVSAGDEYPLVEIQLLLRIIRKNNVVAISGGYFRLFEIFDAVVTDFAFPQSEGLQNQQLFEIQLLSDTPIELILNGNSL
jgi:hypothetical protein